MTDSEPRIRPIDSISPPTGDVERQRHLLWKDLKVDALPKVLGIWKEKIGIDLHDLYSHDFNGGATDKMEDADLKSYFTLDAKGRKYYRIYEDGKGENARGTLVVVEPVTESLKAIAIFYVPNNKDDKDVAWADFYAKGEKRKYTFLNLSGLVLHNTKTNQAVDLADPWLHSKPAFEHAFSDRPQEKKAKIRRRIGLLPKDSNDLSSAILRSAVASQIILATDISQQAEAIQTHDASGLEQVPTINQWLSMLLVAERAISKIEPLHEIEEMTIDFISGVLTGSPSLTVPRQLFRTSLQAQAQFLAPSRDVRVGMQETAPRSAIKIARKEVLSAVGTLLGLRQLGFDLCPNLTIPQLSNEIIKYLRRLDKLYPKLKEEYGLSFASSTLFPPKSLESG